MEREDDRRGTVENGEQVAWGPLTAGQGCSPQRPDPAVRRRLQCQPLLVEQSALQSSGRALTGHADDLPGPELERPAESLTQDNAKRWGPDRRGKLDGELSDGRCQLGPRPRAPGQRHLDLDRSRVDAKGGSRLQLAQ